jgi:hypothetical protein
VKPAAAMSQHIGVAGLSFENDMGLLMVYGHQRSNTSTIKQRRSFGKKEKLLGCRVFCLSKQKC